MYAVIQDGGRTYRVAEGDLVDVDLRSDVDAGEGITFDRVLLVSKDEDVLVGKPTVEGASVAGTVEGTVKGDKLISFKYKRRQGYHRKKGHRQKYTRVRITGISA